jgi:hypothetical protein
VKSAQHRRTLLSVDLNGQELLTARVEARPREKIVRKTNLIVATVVGVLGSAAAVAGQYCLVLSGMPNNCRFVDEESCAQAAMNAGGGCIDKNGQAIRSLGPRDAGYCLVNHGDQKCYYFNAQACAEAAKLEGGTCLTRPKLSTPVR